MYKIMSQRKEDRTLCFHLVVILLSKMLELSIDS